MKNDWAPPAGPVMPTNGMPAGFCCTGTTEVVAAAASEGAVDGVGKAEMVGPASLPKVVGRAVPEMDMPGT